MQRIQSSQQLNPLLRARYLFITLQLIAILLAHFYLQYDLQFRLLCAIVAIEFGLNLGLSLFYKKQRSISSSEFFLQFVLDIGFLTALLYFSGGASNPFVSLLLLPIAIAAVTLPNPLLMLTTLLAMTSYSFLLLTLSPHALHHMDMQQHLVGMWLNFVLSALVVVIIVASLIRAINRQERMLSKHREEQLRQEQVVAMGTAAAQFAHQMATPLGTANLLTEELQETNANNAITTELQQQLQECSRHLERFRHAADTIKKQQKQRYLVQELIAQLNLEIQLTLPQLSVKIDDTDTTNLTINADATVLPALLNLIQNAAQASEKKHKHGLNEQSFDKHAVDIKVTQNSGILTISIRDFGEGLSDDVLLRLGSELVDSKQGLGMGVFLSHATLERLGAKLKISNHPQGGAIAEVSFLVQEIDEDKISNAQALQANEEPRS